MYYSWVYVAIAFLGLLVPFTVPIRLKHPALRRIRTGLLLGLLVSTLIAFTPEKAQYGAPLHKWGAPKITFLSCSYQVRLSTARFCPAVPAGTTDAACFCSNPNARATMAFCYQLANPDLRGFLLMCESEFGIKLSEEEYHQSLANYSQYARSLGEVPGFEPGQVIDFPLKINVSESRLLKKSYDQFLGNYDRSIDYGAVLVAYWVAVFVVAGVANWCKFVFPGLTGPVTNWVRQKLTLPATRSKYKTQERQFGGVFAMLVPTRLETILLAVFFALAAFLCVAQIAYVPQDPLFASRRQALLRFYAVRCSILASSLVPLVVLFGGRNNFLQWLTRWDFATFIALHRWVSRLAVILVAAHSLCYGLYTSHIRRLIRERYVEWGMVGTACGVAMMVQGVLVLRRRYYEVFLALHIVLAWGFIIGAYMHVMDLYCVWFYHYSFAVWVFDRVVRLGWLWTFGFPVARVFLVPDKTLKVVIPTPENWECVPGGHIFLHFLKPACFWQSHPFTYTVVSTNEIAVYIKVKDGVTRDIYAYLSTHQYSEIRVAVEGSYGERTPASRYSTACFIAGGNGIPGIYAEAQDLAHRAVDQRIKLAWVVREYQSLAWFYDELLALHPKIEATVYVTRPEPAGLADETTSLLLPEVSKLKHITFIEGRPSMDLLVRETAREAARSAAFVACGHPVMVDDVRQAVVDNVGSKRVDYFEQLQVWA